MRVIQIIDTLHVGGAERMAINISNVLQEEGHQVLLIVSRTAGELASKVVSGVSVAVLGKYSFADRKAFMKMVRLIREFNPDIVHAHSSSINWAIVIKILFIRKMKLVFHDHYGLAEQLTPKDRPFLRFFGKYIDKVIAVNDLLADWNKKYLSIPEKNILYIPNFPYLNLTGRKQQQPKIQLLCLANFRPQKDHPTLLEAFEILVNEINPLPCELLLVGKSFEDDYFTKVQLLIRDKKLEGKVKVMNAVQNVEEVLEIADIAVLSSLSEGLPVSLLEYGLAGLPVALTAVGQCPDVVEFGKFGKLVEKANPQALAVAMKALIEDTKTAKEMGVAFRQHVLSHYGAQRFLRLYLAFLEEVR